MFIILASYKLPRTIVKPLRRSWLDRVTGGDFFTSHTLKKVPFVMKIDNKIYVHPEHTPAVRKYLEQHKTRRHVSEYGTYIELIGAAGELAARRFFQLPEELHTHWDGGADMIFKDMRIDVKSHSVDTEVRPPLPAMAHHETDPIRHHPAHRSEHREASRNHRWVRSAT